LKQGTAGHVLETSSSWDGTGAPILILAWGNDLRQDDGAGPALARKMGRLAPTDLASTICAHQLTPELALEIAQPGVETVLFVDCRVVQPGESDPVLAMHPLAPDPADPKLGHHVDARMLLLYANALYDKQVCAWSITVPGWAFDHGEEFSPQTQSLLDNADDFIAQVFQRLLA